MAPGRGGVAGHAPRPSAQWKGECRQPGRAAAPSGLGRDVRPTPRLTSQAEISAEIAELAAAYERERGVDGEARGRGSTTRRTAAACCGTRPRTCSRPTPRASSCGRRCFGQRDVDPLEADLTDPARRRADRRADRRHRPGRSTATAGPVRRQLVEIWQANAAGRYIHQRDQHPAPLDPNFTGVGRCLTDADGGYRFTTIKPGPYPWRNHHNAWRPAHIHFSLFGTEFTQRLITQMYFPGDPLFALDPIYQSIADPAARDRLVATYDHDVTAARVVHRLPLGHRAHRHATARRSSTRTSRVSARRPRARPSARSSASPCPTTATPSSCPPGTPGRDPAARPGARRRGRARARRADRDLAGRPRRRGRPAGRARCAATAGPSPAGAAPPPTAPAHYSFTTLRPGAPSPAAPFFAHHGLRPRAARPAASPAPTCPATTRPWPPTRCSPRSPDDRRAHADREPRRAAACASTSGCRATARRSSSPTREH